MISEEKMKIVINNYFKTECNIDTTIRQAFEKGFKLGVSKFKSTLKVDKPDIEYKKGCRNCEHGKYNDHWKTHFCYCPNDCNEWNMWQPKTTGKWIPVNSFLAFGGDESTWMAHGNPTAFYYCSECKEQAYAGEDGESLLTKFCPNCGTKMEE